MSMYITHRCINTVDVKENMLTLCSEHSRIHLAELNYVGRSAVDQAAFFHLDWMW